MKRQPKRDKTIKPRNVHNERPTKNRCGATLRRLRRDHGYTLVSLDETSGVCASNLSKFERGVDFPGLRTICKLAHAFGLTPGDLLNDLLELD